MTHWTVDALAFDGHVGIDEAGRGCLAGPVVAAAVIFPHGHDFTGCLPDLGDSKQLTAATRALLAPAVRTQCRAWSLGLSWPDEIDAVNILNATFRAMSRAAATLGVPLPPLAVDGNFPIRPEAWIQVTRLPRPEQTAVVRGDARIPAIAAASILAKTFRDKLMTSLDRRFPGYGFTVHKGYPTAEHRAAIDRLGPSSMHRRSFRGVRPDRPDQQWLSLP